MIRQTKQRQTGFLSILLTVSIHLSGCTTPEPKAVPEIESKGSVREIDGFRFYEEAEPKRPYTVLGYIEIESLASRSKESVLKDMKTRSVSMGGNAIMDISRDALLETTRPAASYDLGMRKIEDLAANTIIERYRWRATVILLR